ncbi:hypothetical protein FRX31_027764 [Thalictrum thalictroides]|uniref:Uncharacterized protein n=1 Tax=Thalictrum thalictroides TaxID=46969 RepID=A0A7J6VDG0_THATH|nr:hypothetical protein FRX31_027764 [Thalictrum thalictroides]
MEVLHDDNEVNMRSESAEIGGPEGYPKDVRQLTEAVEKVEVKKEGTKGRDNVPLASSFTQMNTTGEVNMEGSMTSDDVVRAGGFGARDDIGSFLPVAIDSTDFESSLRDARDHEEPQEQINRPGLGWTETMQSEEH